MKFDCSFYNYVTIFCMASVILLNPGDCGTMHRSAVHSAVHSDSQMVRPIISGTFGSKSQVSQTTTYDEWKQAGFSPPAVYGTFYHLVRAATFGNAVIGEVMPSDYLRKQHVKLVDHLRVTNYGM